MRPSPGRVHSVRSILSSLVAFAALAGLVPPSWTASDAAPQVMRTQASLVQRLRVPGLASEPDASPFQFRVAPSVPHSEEEIIVGGLWLAWAFNRAWFGRGTAGTIVVTITSEDGVCGPPRTTASGGKGTACFYINEVWRTATPYQKPKIVVHEHVHNLQGEIGCFYPRTPTWFTESMAEYFGYEAVIEAGLVEREPVETIDASVVGRATDLPPLQSYEHHGQLGSEPAYTMFRLAGAQLARIKGSGALLTACERAAQTDWPSAFLAAFGLSVEEFYADFAAYRAELGR
jgi:hypothetical protein